MRMSVVVELLLILLLIAFAAYGRVIDLNQTEQRAISDNSSKQSNAGVSTLSLKQATDNVNRYCTCNENICNCCRDFHIPLVQLQGPGCASLQYLQGDNLAVQLSFGDNILTSTIVNGKSPRPVCVPLPGGFTKFCGRIYSIQREAKNHFKACLGLELQSATELEASLRVSCFRFGPDGLKLRPAEPLPVVETDTPEEDDDDDIFGLGSDDDDEEDDEDDDADNPSEISPLTNSVPDSSAEDEDDDDDDDVLGFGALLDIITGDDETATKKPKVTTPAPLLEFTIPLLTKPTAAAPLNTEPLIAGDSAEVTNDEENEYIPVQSIQPEDNVAEDSDEFSVTEPVYEFADTVTESSNKVVAYAKPGKLPTKKVVLQVNKVPSLTSASINAIETETDQKKKPAKKPVKGDNEDDDDDDDDILDDDDDDDDEEAELLSGDDDEKDTEEEDEYEDEKEVTEQENAEEDDEKAEDLEDLDDDDDEAEDAVISALVYDEKDNAKKRKVKKNHESSEADDDDYELGLSGLLARSRHSRSGRRSKVIRP
ncbi:uncharacterized protein LOC143353016 [Halictus rubicundus]|uniref:uncharacterized protein LOC143353016 n=1 Tax=Halictus rubicundus TaxID=77578 RepID=UPI004036BADF